MSTTNLLPIDVIIPVHNGSKYLLEALDSVNAQSLLPKRLIVVDDGSTDDSQKLIKRYKSKIPLTLISQENLGPSAARNAGFLASDSEYVAFLDADDSWLPKKLASQISVFEKDRLNRLGLVYCDFILINEQGKELSRTLSGPLNPSVKGDAFRALLIQNDISSSNSGVLIRRSSLDTVGIFDEFLPIGACEDWDLWIRLTRHFEVAFVPEPLVRIRRHSGNNSINLPRLAIGTAMVLNKYIAYGRQDKALLMAWEKLYFSTFTWLILTKHDINWIRKLRVTMNAELRSRYLQSLPRQIARFIRNRLMKQPTSTSL